MGSSKPGTYRSVLARPDFRKLFGALTISAVGSWAQSTVLAVYFFERTHSAEWLSAYVVLRLAVSTLSSPYSGVIAERFERIRLMVTLDSSAFFYTLLLAFVIAEHAPIGLILAMGVVTSMMLSPYEPALSAVLPQIAGEDDLGPANSLNLAISNLAVVFGPAVGALMLLLGSTADVLVFNAATFGASALFVVRLKVRSKPSDVTEGGKASALGQLGVGVKAILSNRTVALLVGFCLLDSCFDGLQKILYIVVSHRQIGGGTASYGFLFAMNGIGGIVAASFANRLAKRNRLALTVVLGMTALFLPMAGIAFTHERVVAYLLTVVSGMGMFVVDVVAVTAMQRSLAPELIARVFGIFWAVITGGIMISTIAATAVLNAVGLRGALIAFGFGVTALSVLGYPLLRSGDRAAAARAELLRPIAVLLEGCELFATAGQAALERLAALASCRIVDAGTAVVREGEAADALYLIEEGTVQVTAAGEAGIERSLRTMTAGQYFGEIGLLESIPRTATVTATSPLALYRIEGPDFLAALARNTGSARLMADAASRLSLSHPSYEPHAVQQAAAEA
ncbi:MAG: MFS transporter [Acidimicrobiales bacterium]